MDIKKLEQVVIQIDENQTLLAKSTSTLADTQFNIIQGQNRKSNDYASLSFDQK